MYGTKRENAKLEFENYVNDIVDLIPDSYTDYEKILFVNDYLCLNHEYDTSLSIFDAYNFFKKGTGVCQSYTLAFMAIMDELGIKCDSVSSEEMNHVWNCVQLNGNWYHIDVTWHDPIPDSYGRATHTYFLLSDNYIADVSVFGEKSIHYGYEKEYDCSDTSYDGKGYESGINSQFINFQDKWYAVGYDSQKYTCNLYEFQSSDLSAIDFDNVVSNIGLWNGYPFSFGALAKYENAIVFNNSDSLFVFDGTNIATLYTPDLQNGNKIYGFRIKNDTLQLQLQSAPKTDAIFSDINLCPVVFKDCNNNALANTFALEGADVLEIFVPEAPKKESDENFEYVFTKWVKSTSGNSIVFTPEYEAIPTKEFVIDGTTLVRYNEMSDGAKTFIILPEEITAIKSEAFADVENITSVKLGNNVKSVEAGAFPDNIKIYFSASNNELEASVISSGFSNFAYMGDINGDSVITADDIVLIRKHLSSLDTNGSADICAADLDFSGVADTDDLVLLRKIIAGLIKP